MFVVRPRAESDLDACIAVLARVQAHEGYPRTHQPLDAFIAHGPDMPLAWVAEQDERIIGHVALGRATDADLAVRTWRAQVADPPKLLTGEGVEPLFPGGIAVLERLYVDPDARRGGAAAALIGAAVAEAHERRLRLVLFVLEANDAARRLYERLGWVVYGYGTFRYPGPSEGEQLQMAATCFASPLPAAEE